MAKLTEKKTETQEANEAAAKQFSKLNIVTFLI